MDSAFPGDRLEPGVLAFAQLAEALLELEHPCELEGLVGSNALQDRLVDPWLACFRELLRLPVTPGLEDPGDVVPGGGVEVGQLRERRVLDVPHGGVVPLGGHRLAGHVGEGVSELGSQLF